MKRLKTVLRLLAGTALLAGLLVSPAAPVAAHNDDDSLAAVRAATAAFHSIDAAELAGYARPLALPCFDKPGVGGMGLHWINPDFVGSLRPTEPAALVYEVDGDELTLVAVEYLVPIAAPQPHLFGQAFHPAYLPHGGAALNLWALHAWVWRSNPLGMFADYNPRVELCPGTPSDD